MKHSNPSEHNTKVLCIDSKLEAECINLLNQSITAMPASVHSRLTAIRHSSLEQLANTHELAGASVGGWRSALAGLALCVVACCLLFLPHTGRETFSDSMSYSWGPENESLLGDDLSLHMWLFELDDDSTEE